MPKMSNETYQELDAVRTRPPLAMQKKCATMTEQSDRSKMTHSIKLSVIIVENGLYEY